MTSFTIAFGSAPVEPILMAILIILIPTIIIEAILLKNILKKNWGESFEFCSIANVASSIAGIIFVFILFGTLSLIKFLFEPSKIIAILCWISIPAILIWVENAIARKYWKDISKKKLLKAIIIVNIVSYLILSILSLIMPEQGCAREPARRISCSCNLKQIGLSLKQYADDYNGYFPDKGLEQLRVNDYLTDYGVYNCPSTDTRKGKDNEKLTDEIVDYVYQKGLKFNLGAQNSKIPIVWDKAKNHVGYGNVLFLDGHVKGFKTHNKIDWMEQAGIMEIQK